MFLAFKENFKIRHYLGKKLMKKSKINKKVINNKKVMNSI